MADSRGSSTLQVLFAIFLGLMVTAFVGVGVYTFYPPPAEQYQARITDLDRQQQAIRNSRPDVALSDSDRARIQGIVDQRDRLQDVSNAATRRWSARTSIILVAFATLAMAISLAVIARVPVLDGGLLMGGVFTMLYGVGWVIASGNSTSRFVVMTIAFAITLALGYVRFARRRTPVEASGAGVADLEQRVHALEHRVAQAATALSHQ